MGSVVGEPAGDIALKKGSWRFVRCGAEEGIEGGLVTRWVHP
jgi:hypothetical protein